MKQVPFGNLTNWRTVLDIFNELADSGKLSECQPGLIRMLKYKGSWRLREEVLKRVGGIQSPSPQLIYLLLRILDDDNSYYDVRVLASEALSQMLRNVQDDFDDEINVSVRKVTERLRAIPHPYVFENALKNLFLEINH